MAVVVQRRRPAIGWIAGVVGGLVACDVGEGQMVDSAADAGADVTTDAADGSAAPLTWYDEAMAALARGERVDGFLHWADIPAGAPIPGWPELTRGVGPCDLMRPTPGPIPYAVRPQTEQVDSVELHFLARYGDLVEPGRLHRLECDLGSGCPELLWQQQTPHPDDTLAHVSAYAWRTEPWFPIGVGGDIFVPRRGGLTRLAADGSLLSYEWLGSARNVVPMQDGGYIEVHALLSSGMAGGPDTAFRRVNAAGDTVWIRHNAGSGLAPIPTRDSTRIAYLTNFRDTPDPRGTRDWDLTYVAIADAATGEVLHCTEGPPEPLGPDGEGALVGDWFVWVTSESATFVHAITGERRVVGLTRVEDRPDMTFPAYDGPSTLSDATAVVWFDGSIVLRDWTQFFRLDPVTLEIVEQWDINEALNPTSELFAVNRDFYVGFDGRVLQLVNNIPYVFSGFGEGGEVEFLGRGSDLIGAVLAADGVWIRHWVQPVCGMARTLDPGQSEGDFLWYIDTPGGCVGNALTDDGRWVVLSDDGVVSVWQTPHGGPANTPRPTHGFDATQSRLAPVPPYQTAPSPRTWLWPDEVDDADAGSGG